MSIENRMLQAITLGAALGALGVNLASALNEPTHKVINEKALTLPGPNGTSIDQILKQQIGLSEGIQESLKGRRTFEWLGEGGVNEDSPFCRSARHFHDPLQPWDSAGLFTLNPFIDAGCFGFSFPSSIRWGQDANQNLGGNWSWHDARRFLFNAMTSSNKDSRDQGLADTFRALGQVMHLVVDASVPEHVRNDPHILESFCRFFGRRCYGNYEYWVSENIGSVAGSVGFASTLLQQSTGDAQATVPIARLIDSETYRGLATGPNVTTGTEIGIAEFANANFFSEDTFSGQYPFPSIANLQRYELPAPSNGIRAYYRKDPQDGFPVDPVLAECVLGQADRDEGRSAPGYYCVDDKVWAATANVMLPRAVGYAKGILDYFFRGRLEVVMASENPSADLSTGLKVKVRNNTPDNQETANGTVVGVLEVQESDTKSWLVSADQELEISGVPKEINFSFGGTPSSSPGATLTLMVVYKGPLKFGGQNGPGEDQAVVVGRAPLKPLDLNPKDSMFACGDTDPKVTFTASGGLPPYTWSTTKGEVIPIDAQNAELTPSANNANVDPGSTAYMWVVNDNQPVTCNQWAGGCYRDRYNCANTALAICEFATGDNCGHSDLLCDCTLGTGCIGICGQVQSKGALKDTRSQAMIDQGCKPCAVEMQGGATVTVTDASGASASTTVAVAQ